MSGMVYVSGVVLYRTKEGDAMTRHTERLWRAVLLDEQGRTRMFVLYAVDADHAADEAERMSGFECVIVDDVTPARRKVAA